MNGNYHIPDEPGIVREDVTYYLDKSLEDFEALPEGTLAQYIHGELIMTPSPLFRHQVAVNNLQVELNLFVRTRQLGFVVAAPMDVQFSEENIFQPDIFFVSHERSGIITDRRIMGAPDLVVEVLSRSTGYYDLTIKKNVYAEYGVREYWIVDPMKCFIRILVNDGGRFVQLQQDQEEGLVRSTILDGFEVDVSTIFSQDYPPDKRRK